VDISYLHHHHELSPEKAKAEIYLPIYQLQKKELVSFSQQQSTVSKQRKQNFAGYQQKTAPNDCN